MYVQREIREKFKKIMTIYPIIALVGARQSGKTTFLKEQIKGMNSSYLLFDDPDIMELFEEDIKKFEKQFIEGYDVSVLDEVHYCKDAGRKLKYLADRHKKIWVTSSSEILLNKEVLSYLVGRVSILRLYPFSIQEFLNFKKQKEITSKMLQRNIWEHLTFGGYPKVVTINDFELKKTILRDLYDTMILKDIAKAFSIEDLKSLEDFVRYLSLNIGNAISYENISNDISLSFQTLRKYLNAMEKSYLIFRVSPFYTNKLKEITKQQKVYFVDTGMRNVIARKFDSHFDGDVFENYVLSELLKIGLYPKYWRTKTKAEVDFIIEDGREIIPLEVKMSANPGKIERSMRSFIEKYSPKKAFIVTYKGEKGEMKVNKCRIIFTDIIGMRKALIKIKS